MARTEQQVRTNLEAQGLTGELREALYELQRYLSDAIAPLMMTDSMEVLLRHPAQLTSNQIHAWASAQYRGPGASVPMSDYLFHAMKKIHLMGEYDLVPREAVLRFLGELAQYVLAYCPVEDRDLLRSNISRLGEAPTILSSAVDYLHRQAGSEERPLATTKKNGEPAPNVGAAVPLTPEIARGLRSFGLLVNRLQRSASVDGGTPGPTATRASESREILTQLLTMAAVNARSGSELGQQIERLQDYGLKNDTRELFRELGQSLPDWTPPVPAGPEQLLGATPGGPLGAMHRLVTLTDDPSQGVGRLHEMVHASIEQFNNGALGRAATMFDLAERIIVEKKIDYESVRSIREKSHELLDVEVLRKFAETADKHQLLRKVLNFFTALTPAGLIETLEHEDKRDRRRLALALLEAHGQAARAAAAGLIEELIDAENRDPHKYLQRNLIYILRRIPPGGETNVEHEVDVVSSILHPQSPLFLMKEIVAYLGQAKHEHAERALTDLLGDLERMLLRPKESRFEVQEARQLIDRVVSALARFGTISSARTAVAHSLRRQAQLGDTMARLTDLGGRDLSSDPETVEKLLKTLRNELPIRILGFVIQRKAENVFYLIEALSSTPSAAVRETLESIVSRFPDHDFGRAAAKTLAGFGATPRQAEAPAASLVGDLELFGLPSLLQTLAEACASGMLTIKDLNGDSLGHVILEQGKVIDAQSGKLRGPEAIYQLFERPSPGSFSFVSRRDGSLDPDRGAAAHDMLPLVFEAMRRHDEFRQARVIVPDEVSFEVTGIRPEPHPDEKDPNLARLLWTKVRTGATAADCEIDVAADSFRVRRLLVHWVEQGALQQI